MLGRMFSRKKAADKDADKAIVHQFVPEEVLAVSKSDAPPVDTSWMNATPAPRTPVEPTAVAEEAHPEPAEATPVADSFVNDENVDGRLYVTETLPPNPAAAARAKFPVGWLVVVEGAGVGEWFVLERGVSHIGSAEGQTVQVDFGDASIAPVCHAEIVYKDDEHQFQLSSRSKGSVRLNGKTTVLPAVCRDGDVITLGGTSLRLIGLCTPNFNWG